MSKPDTKSISIEDKLAQLDTAVEWFYGDEFSLDQAIDKYRAAADLAREIEQDLTQLRNEVEVVADFTKPGSSAGPSSSPETSPES